MENRRDPAAVIRCRLILAFGKGASAGLILGLVLILIGAITHQISFSIPKILLISALWCGVFGYLISLIKQLLLPQE